MKCEEFEVHLNEILDERRRPEWDEQLRLHGEACRGCRDLAAAYGVLFEGFFALPTPEAPADLSARVLEQLQSKPLVSPRLAVLGAVFSTAAALLIAVTLMRGNGRRDAGGVDTQLAQLPTATTPLATGDYRLHWDELSDVPFFGPWLASLNDPPGSDPYANLAKDTGEGLAAVVLRMPRLAGPQGVQPPTPGTVYGTMWPMQVSEELRPVAESMTETFNLILDALPLTFWSEDRTRAS